LDDRSLINWAGFDSFLNSCLLGRPARRFSPGPDNLGVAEWKDIVGDTQDPRFSSHVRYFSRDASSRPLGPKRQRNADGRAVSRVDARLRASGPAPTETGYEGSLAGGVAAWNDFSSAAMAARQALNNAAGISVPNGQFVLKLLAVYLMCLVPLNWGVFRVFQRVEWAWMAAPVIAVLGTLSVIKLAQLDIGFVRSRTEVTVVETQPEYARAHVTRFVGLYSSLTSRYQLAFEGVDGVALPFSTNPSGEELRLATPDVVEFRQQAGNQLSGLPVFSNSTGMVHVEQMLNLGDTVRLLTAGGEEASLRIENQGNFDLKSALLVRRQQGRFQILPVGDLPAGKTVTVALQDVSDQELNQFLERVPATCRNPRKGEPGLRGLMEVALDPCQLAEGDVRLVAWSTDELDGLAIRPRASQRSTRIVWVHQLRYGETPDPVPDQNLLEEVRRGIDDVFLKPVEASPGEASALGPSFARPWGWSSSPVRPVGGNNSRFPGLAIDRAGSRSARDRRSTESSFRHDD
jgi:hypothetical protein